MQRDTFIDPALIEPHYSTRIYRGYLVYLERKLGLEQAEKLIEKTGLSWAYLTKESNWVSETYAERFYDVCSKEPLLPPDYSYQAGKASMAPETQGPVQLLAMQFLDAENLFSQIVFFSQRFNRVDKVTIRTRVRGRLSLELTPNRLTNHFDQFVQSWRGFLEETPRLLGLPPASIVITRVSDRSAILDVEWTSNRLYYYLQRTRFLMGAGTIGMTAWLLIAATFYRDRESTVEAFVAFLISLCMYFITSALLESLRRKIGGTDTNRLSLMIKEAEDRYQELYESKILLDRRYKEAKLLEGVAQRISANLASDELVQTTLREIKETLLYDRVIYMARNPDTNRLFASATVGFGKEELRQLASYTIDLAEQTDNPMHLGNVYKKRRSILVPITQDFFSTLSGGGKMMLYLTKSRSFLACSVHTEKSGFGVLLADYTRPGTALSQDDVVIVERVARELALGLSKAEVLEKERRLRLEFQRFVPPQVMKSMIGEDSAQLDRGVTRQITVLVSDIRNFTERTRSTDPQLLIQAINFYFAEMTNIVYRCGGIVDKFLGDGILACFNSFGNQPDHVLSGVAAAAEMLRELPRINRTIQERFFYNSSWTPFEIGIGIHSGAAIVGNLGTQNKTEFTAIGDAVNIASRLGEISKKFPNHAVLSSIVCESAKEEFTFKSGGIFALRGFEREIEVFLLHSQAAPESGQTTRPRKAA